jgi:CheY-like chemotaxis protein
MNSGPAEPPFNSLPLSADSIRSGMKTILLIEDDLVMRTVYQRFLQSHGFAVELAVDGDEGMAKLAEVQPDAVIVDVMMPKRNGIAVVQHIRAQEGLNKMPVVVLTNAAIPAFIEQARTAGADHVFDKSKDWPIAVVGLLEKLLAAAPQPQQAAG